MKHTITLLAALFATVTSGACKREAPSPAIGSVAAATPTRMAPTAPVAPPVPPPPAVDPLWPAWSPPIPGVHRRLAHEEIFSGYAEVADLTALVSCRRAFEGAGFALSQTALRRTPWETKLSFTATRGAEFVFVEVIGTPRSPNYATVSMASGRVGRSLATRRVR